MPRNTRFDMPLEDRRLFLSRHYRRHGSLRPGHSSIFQVCQVEDQALQQWNLQRNASNLRLLYSHPIQDMHKVEAEFFNIDPGKNGVQSAAITSLRLQLCQHLGYDSGRLPDFARYINYCKRHVARDYAEALADCTKCRGDLSEFLEAQRAWSGATRQFELACMSINVQRCPRCNGVNLYRHGGFEGICVSCKTEIESSRQDANSSQEEQEAQTGMFSANNWATPAQPLPGAALLTDDEKAALSPALPYIRVLKAGVNSRGNSYGHAFIAPQQIADIVKNLPRLPSEIHFAQISDIESNVQWSVNVPKLVHMMYQMDGEDVLRRVFRAHGVKLYGHECSARLQEWDQSSRPVPRIDMASDQQPHLNEYCADDYLEDHLDDRIEVGPDNPANNGENDCDRGITFSMLQDDTNENGPMQGVAAAIRQLDGYAENTVSLSCSIRGQNSIPDNHPDLFNLCFPYLNFGRADFFYSLEGRPRAFTSRHMWLKHIVSCDSRFCADKMFVFVAQNWVQKAQVMASAAVYMKKQSASSSKSLDDIHTELKEGDYSSLNDIVSFARSIQGSVPYWRDVRDRVKDFFDWKCLSDVDVDKRKFHINSCGYPAAFTDQDSTIDLTSEEQQLIHDDNSARLVYLAAASERIWSTANEDYTEDTQAAYAVFQESLGTLLSRVYDFWNQSPWEIHTVLSTLRHRIHDTSVDLKTRAEHALVACRLQFLRFYSAFDCAGCQRVLDSWNGDTDTFEEELEMFMVSAPTIDVDADTVEGAYTCHAQSFALLFRERSFQFMSAANPGFFITGSMAEHHWPELWRVMLQYVMLDSDQSDPWLNRVKSQGFNNSADKVEALRRYPHVSTTLFKIRTELLYDLVLSPVLGIDDKIIRYEFADGRGEIHFHSLNWSAKWPIGLLVENRDEQAIIKFARVWLRLSGEHPSADLTRQKYHEYGNPQGDRSTYAGPHHPSKQLFVLLDPDMIEEWDVRMCNANFSHSCIRNSYCLRPTRGKNGTDYICPGAPGDRCNRCRFDFHVNNWSGKGSVQVEDAHIVRRDINSIPDLIMERNSPFLVQHSRFFRRAWKANCDFTVIVDPDPSRIQGYIVSYMCKEGVATTEYKHFFRSMVFTDETNDVSHLVRKVMLRILGHRDRSAQEVFFTAAGHALYNISCKRGCVINLGDLRRALSKTSFLGSNVVDKYVKSKSGNNGVSLYEFAQDLQEGYVQLSGSRVYCSWPLSERYCQAMLLLHCPWSEDIDVLGSRQLEGSYNTFKSKFVNEFLYTQNCPRIVYAQVMFAKLVHDMPSLRPRNHFSIKDAGSGSLATFLRSYGNRSLDVDLNHAMGEDIKYPPVPPGWDWSSTALWGDLSGIDIERALQAAKYDDIELAATPSLRELNPLSVRTTSNLEQCQALSIILNHCMNRHSDPQSVDTLKIVLHGAAGTGKSYAIKTISAAVRALTGDPKSVLVITPTGAAASQVDGETIHRGLGISVNGKRTSSRRDAELASDLYSLRVLVIDEMSMLDSAMLHTIQQRLRHLLGIDSDDGWQNLWCIVLSGDFMQLPPVQGVPLYTTVNSNAENSRHGQVLYRQFNNCILLHKVERITESSSDFTETLQSLRDGANIDQALACINSRVITTLSEDERAAFDTHDTTHFVAYNADRIQRNVDHLQHVEGPVTPVVSTDRGSKKHCNAFDSATHFCGLQSRLWLGRGVRVVMCLNLRTKCKLTKGRTGCVRAVYYAPGHSPPEPPTMILVQMDKPVADVLANRVSPHPQHRDLLSFIPSTVPCEEGCCVRVQVPFELCAALTVHKSQGSTVDSNTVVHLSARAESQWPGITYTALSRFTSLSCFSLPQPLTRDALVTNRRNLYASGRAQAMARLLSLKNSTLERFRSQCTVEYYSRIVRTYLDIEHFRQGAQ